MNTPDLAPEPAAGKNPRQFPAPPANAPRAAAPAPSLSRPRIRRAGPVRRIATTIFTNPFLSFLFYFLAASAVMLLRMFVPFATGLADNGDGSRYVCQLALEPVDATGRYFGFAILDWVQGAAIPDDCTVYPSSEIWILRGAVHFTQMLGGASGSLDLRLVMVAYALLSGLLIALFSSLLRRGIAFRAVVSIVFLMVLADGTFANYAGSVYGEFPGIVGVAIMSVAAVFAATSGKRQIFGYLLFAAGTALVLTSKTQGVTVLIPAAIFLLCTTMRTRTGKDERKRWNARRISGTVLGKIVPAAIALVLVVPVLWILDNNPKQFQAINPWELISVGILGNSQDPAADLEEMGFPRNLSRYAGDSVWTEDSILNSPQWDENKENMTYITAAKFLLAHPDRGIVILNNAGNDFLDGRPNYLGSYTEDSGKAERAQDLSMVSDLSLQTSGVGIIPLALMWAAMIWGVIVMFKRSAPGSIRRAFAKTVLLLIGIALVQLLTASFGEAIENTKHMVYGILAGALAPVFLLAGALTPENAGLKARAQALEEP